MLAKLLPALTGEALLPTLIRHLGVGNGDLAAQLFKRGAVRGFRGTLGRGGQKLVDGGVDAADKKARHARDAIDRLTRGDAILKPAQERFDDLLVDVLREQERDVDVEAVGEKLADRRQPR